MTALRKRLIEDIQLKGLSKRTEETYVRAVGKLSEHFHKSPDLISEGEIRDYFLYLKNVKHYARASSTIALCGIKFFFTHPIKREWPTLIFVRLSKEKALLLPVKYFRVTFSLPEAFRKLARSHRKNFYSLFFPAFGQLVTAFSLSIRAHILKRWVR